MAKSKNHTNHNQNYKAHRNGIKKPKRVRWISTKYIGKRCIVTRMQLRATQRTTPYAPIVHHLGG
eukprot:COSAG02_NODE_3264_length_7066_cov_91.385101_7_plen_65_part_00